MSRHLQLLPPLRANAHLPQLPIPTNLSINAQQRLAPGTRLKKTVENLGLRLGYDKIPQSVKPNVRVPIRQPRGRITPHWHSSTIVRPPIEAIPIPHNRTRLGRFMINEWKRFCKSEEEESYTWTRIPQGYIRNPFLPWFNPVSRRWVSPLYSRREQAVLSKEARRLNLTSVLPSGPKTRPEYSNKQMLAWQVAEADSTTTTSAGGVVGVEGGGGGAEPKVEDLGEVKWYGVYMKKLNPFGRGKFGEEMSLDELKAGLGVGGLPPVGKMEYVENKQMTETRKIGDGYERRGPTSGKIELFKETKRHLRKERKVRETQTRMELMPQRVVEWRKEVKAAKIKALPALPY